MKFTLENNEQASINRYEPGIITVGREQYQSNIILRPDQVITDWSAPDIAKLSLEDLQMALIEDLEVLILGTGVQQQFPPMQLAAKLSQARIGFEVMSTAAACRTYNILLSENRTVSAALII